MDDIAFAQNKVFIGFQGRAFYALDESTGDVLWEFSDGFTRSIGPVANEDVVCFGCWDFHVLRSNDGEPLWSIRSNDGSSWVHSLIQKDTLYVAQGGEIRMTDRDYLHAFETFTGKEIWSYPANEKRQLNSFTKANDQVYIGAHELHVLDAKTGA